MEKKYENLLETISEKLTLDELRELSNIIDSSNKELKNEIYNFLIKKSYEKQKDLEIKNKLGFSKKELIGLKLKNLKTKFPTLKIRVFEINGEDFVVTCDYDMSRLNVSLENVEIKDGIVNEDEGFIKDCKFG